MARTEKAYDRGDSDAYYGRSPKPHIWLDSLGKEIVYEEDMTQEEIDAFWRGYEENPSDRKNWR
jgi:hypothetical protein